MKLTIAEMRRQHEATGGTWFSTATARRRRIESDPVRMPDGGCVFVITETDGTAPKGTPNSRTPMVVRFYPDGRIAQVDLGWLDDTPTARRAAKAYARAQR